MKEENYTKETYQLLLKPSMNSKKVQLTIPSRTLEHHQRDLMKISFNLQLETSSLLKTRLLRSLHLYQKKNKNSHTPQLPQLIIHAMSLPTQKWQIKYPSIIELYYSELKYSADSILAFQRLYLLNKDHPLLISWFVVKILFAAPFQTKKQGLKGAQEPYISFAGKRVRPTEHIEF